MNKKWHIFLKKERLKKRIYLSKKTNNFFESLEFITMTTENQTPFVIIYHIIFEQVCLERITAIRSHMFMENQAPFVTWKVKEKNQTLQNYLSLTNEEKSIVDELLNEFLVENISFFTQKK